ncbi:MAG TPA: hypothetical protein DCY75_02645 [Clostridiales bacterium]|nr:hypothetical protein [Clostridiales bacterium]
MREVIMNEVFQTIDELFDPYKQIVLDLVNMESKSTNKAGVDAVGTYIADLMASQGYKIHKEPMETAGNVYCITLNPHSPHAPVCLSGHMDTVFDDGVFGFPPASMDDTYFYGPGVCDCKGGIVVAMLTMEALRQSGYTKRPVKLILQSDEEVNSMLSQGKTVQFMCEQAKDAVAFLNCMGIRGHNLVTRRKGICDVQIQVTGKAAHAQYYFDGASAIRAAAHIVLEIEKHSAKNGITYNFGLIKGGSARNAVPDTCMLELDCRFTEMADLDHIQRVLHQVLEKTYVEGTHANITRLHHRPSMVKNAKNKALFDQCNRALRQCGLPEYGETSSGGGSDAAYTTLAGIPTLESMGVRGYDIHTPYEKAEIASLKEQAKAMAALILSL